MLILLFLSIVLSSNRSEYTTYHMYVNSVTVVFNPLKVFPFRLIIRNDNDNEISGLSKQSG